MPQRFYFARLLPKGRHSSSVSVQKGKKGVERGWYIAQGTGCIPWLVEEGECVIVGTLGSVRLAISKVISTATVNKFHRKVNKSA
jgi:hypothetical protein